MTGSVALPEVGVNIGGSIADANAGVCSIFDEEGVPLAASLDVGILFDCVVEGENQIGGACLLSLTDRDLDWFFARGLGRGRCTSSQLL